MLLLFSLRFEPTRENIFCCYCKSHINDEEAQKFFCSRLPLFMNIFYGLLIDSSEQGLRGFIIHCYTFPTRCLLFMTCLLMFIAANGKIQ